MIIIIFLSEVLKIGRMILEIIKEAMIQQNILNLCLSTMSIYEGDLYFLGNKKETIRIIEYSNYIHYSKPMCGFNLNINELYACFSSKDYYPIYNKQATYSIYDNLIIIGSKFDTDVEKIYKEAQNEKKE